MFHVEQSGGEVCEYGTFHVTPEPVKIWPQYIFQSFRENRSCHPRFPDSIVEGGITSRLDRDLIAR